MANRFIAGIKRKLRMLSGRKGFTMLETLVTVAVIALLGGIMVPTVLSISNSLTDRQADDYAKSIYIAAQTQLSSLKAAQPITLSTALDEPPAIPQTDNAELGEAWNNSLHYAVSGRDQTFLDSILLPVGSIDDTLRNKKILVEYNSLTGEVCSVFFLNEAATAEDYLTYNDVSRAVAERRAIHLGYYQAETSSNISLPESYTENLLEYRVLSFENSYNNSGDGVLNILVPLPEGHPDAMRFADSLSIKLKMTGNNSSAEKVIDLTGDSSGRASRLTDTSLTLDGCPAVGFSFILDSVYTPAFGFDRLVNDSGFELGENVTLSVTIEDSSEVTTFETMPASLTVNPLYERLSGGTLKVANARNLQNLNKYTASDTVSTVMLSNDINWYADKTFTPLENKCNFQTFDGNGKTISGLTINNSTLSGNNVGLFAALTAADKDSKPVIRDLTLDGLTITLDNSADKYVGAIVGNATDAIVRNCAATDISFTLDKTDASTCVGGLIGVMNGGTLEGSTSGTAATVSGTITKTSGTTGFVGGAVGKDAIGSFSVGSSIDSAVYSKVNADVKLEAWDGTSNPSAAGDPSGLGVNVGKFIGYVNSGSFSDCSGTGESDKPYQFLGQIAYNTASLAKNSFVSSDDSKNTYSTADEGTFTSLAAYAESKGMTAKTVSNDYTASLANCTFKNGSNLRKQVIASQYLYLGSEGKGETKITGASVKKITSLSKSNLSADRDTTRYIIYDVTNNAILVIPDVNAEPTSTPPSPVIDSDGLLIAKENSTSCTKNNYGWGFNDFRMENNMLFFAYSGGYNIRFAKGYFYDVSGGSMDIYQFGNGEFTFLDTYNSTYYLKFNPETRAYDVTKASSKSTPPADAPHFILYEYKMSGLSPENIANKTNTLVFDYIPAGYILELQTAGAGYLCTSEAAN